MKKKILLLSVLMLSMMAFGQKSEIKALEKAVKSNDFDAAIELVNQSEGLFVNVDQKTKAKFYYLKGKSLYRNGADGIDVIAVGAAFKELLDYETETNKYKYTDEIGVLINDLIKDINDKAQQNYSNAVSTKNPEDFIKAAKGFHQVYMLSPRDTSFLDNAALVYNLGQDYENSIELYKELLDLNYTGISTNFTAVSKANGEELAFASKKDMDLQVKLGVVENPKAEVTESRREVMYKNLAQSYASLEKLDKSMEILGVGREEFPDSYDLLIDEANIFYRLGDNAKFKEKLEQAIQMNPTEPTLYYNVGVMNMSQGNLEVAIKHFEKAVELKPDYGDAYNNIGAAIIETANPIIEEMNKSLSDFDKYDELQEEQIALYKKAIPYYEKALGLDDEDTSLMQTLIGLYENVEMMDERDKLKQRLDELTK
jgi:tetratricopeptide (TPR) repeat protein